MGEAISPTRQRSRNAISRKSRMAGIVLAIPYLIALIAFGVYPTGYALYLSFVNNRGELVGFDNFIGAFTDYRFWPAAANVGLYMLVVIPLLMIMTLVIALVLQLRRGPLATFARMMYYLPGAFTGAATVLMWFFLLDPDLGPFAWLLRPFGLEYVTQVATFDRFPLFFALMTFTAASGGWIVIMYGALNSVGADVMEAAEIDGAGAWQRAVRIQIPLIRKYVVYMFVLTFAGAAQLFTEPQIFGAVLRGSRTWSLNQLSLVLGIQEGKTGQSTVISVLLLVIGLLGALWLIYRSKFFESNLEV